MKPGTRYDFKTGQYFPTLDGIDFSPSSCDESRALEIAQQAACKGDDHDAKDKAEWEAGQSAPYDHGFNQD